MYEQSLLAFGKTIRAIRQSKSISQEELAEMSGLHRTYISDIELGKRNISYENMIRISLALDTRLSDIIKEVEKNAGI